MSRFHKVVEATDSTRISVCDLDGGVHMVSLIAYEGPPVEVGDWIVVHSGFALARAEPAEAEAAISELAALTEKGGA